MKNELQKFQTFLELSLSESADEAVLRGNELAVIIARTGFLLAQAKMDLNIKKKSDIMKALSDVAKNTPFATSRAVNELISSICAEEQFLVDWCDRIHRTSVHQLDWVRSIISKAKEEMKYQNMIV